MKRCETQASINVVTPTMRGKRIPKTSIIADTLAGRSSIRSEQKSFGSPPSLFVKVEYKKN